MGMEAIARGRGNFFPVPGKNPDYGVGTKDSKPGEG